MVAFADRHVVQIGGGESRVPLTPQEIAERNAEATASSQREATVTAKGGRERTIRDRAAAALATNATYLAQPALPASPTNAQLISAVRVIRAQVDALTRQSNGLIRINLDILDDIAGT